MAEAYIRRRQQEFLDLVRLYRADSNFDSNHAYSQLDPLLQRIVWLHQERAIRKQTGHIQYIPIADHADAIVKGVGLKAIRVPKPQSVPISFIVGTCYSGEANFYERFIPETYYRIGDELGRYIERGFTLPPVWVFSLSHKGRRGGFVIDGHGRTSFANCIGLRSLRASVFD